MNNIDKLVTKKERAEIERKEIEKKYHYDSDKAVIGMFLADGNNVVGGIDYTFLDKTEYLEEFKKQISFEKEMETWKEKYISEKEDTYRKKIILG